MRMRVLQLPQLSNPAKCWLLSGSGTHRMWTDLASGNSNGPNSVHDTLSTPASAIQPSDCTPQTCTTALQQSAAQFQMTLLCVQARYGSSRANSHACTMRSAILAPFECSRLPEVSPLGCLVRALVGRQNVAHALRSAHKLERIQSPHCAFTLSALAALMTCSSC